MRTFLVFLALYLPCVFYLNGQDKVNVNVNKTVLAPVLDGEEDELWLSIEGNTIEKYVGTEEQTIEATWKALWCDTAFFILISVTDDDFYPAYIDNSEESWLYDKCEVYLDINDILEDGEGPDSAFSGHWQVAPEFEEGMDGNGAYLSTGWVGHIPDVWVAYTIDYSNYTVEICVPSGNLSDKNGIVLDSIKAGSSLIGFDVQVNDFDFYSISTSYIHWQNSDGPYNNMDNCGTITCIGKSGGSTGFRTDFLTGIFTPQEQIKFYINLFNSIESDFTISDISFTNSNFSTNQDFPLTIKSGTFDSIPLILNFIQHSCDKSNYTITYKKSGSDTEELINGSIETAVFIDDNSETALTSKRAVLAYNSSTINKIAKFNNRGVIYELLNKYELAKVYLDSAVTMALNSFYGFTGIKMNQGVVESDQLNPSNAFDYYNEALTDISYNYYYSALIPQIEYNLAWEYYNAGDFYNAETYALSTIENVLSNVYLKAKAYVLLGAIHRHNDYNEEATEAFNQAIGLDPDGPIGNLARENLQIVDIKEVIEKNISIFPQPANDFISVEIVDFIAESENVSIRIHDLNGKIVYEKEYSKIVDLKGIKSGVYIIQIYNSSWILNKKLIINK